VTTPETRVRRALAERIARAYTAVGADAVLLGGSTARGEADRYSDIELGVFWSRAPTDEQRAEAITLADGDLHRLWPFDHRSRAWFDDWFVGRRNGVEKSGIAVEPVHMTVDDAQGMVADVVERFDPALEKQVLLAALCDGISLAGAERLAIWRERAVAYPDELARAVIARHARIDNFWRLAMFRERGNALRVAETITDVVQRILHALLAVNRVYWYGFKSLESLERRLTIAPRNLSAGIRAAYESRDAEPLLADLAEETYDLVEEHVPNADVDRLRAVLRYRRALWEGDDAPAR
jgi:hypothetical protein